MLGSLEKQNSAQSGAGPRITEDEYDDLQKRFAHMMH